VSDRALGWVEAAIAFPSFADRGEFDRFSCSWGRILGGLVDRHRSRSEVARLLIATVAVNFMVNLISGLMVYCHQPKKPAHPEWALPPAA
jgi:hypothetical protein